MASARTIMLIVLTVAMNWTHLLVSALKLLHNNFYGAIVTNVPPRKKHSI